MEHTTVIWSCIIGVTEIYVSSFEELRQTME
jgi:hypothetical protein